MVCLQARCHNYWLVMLMITVCNEVRITSILRMLPQAIPLPTTIPQMMSSVVINRPKFPHSVGSSDAPLRAPAAATDAYYAPSHTAPLLILLLQYVEQFAVQSQEGNPDSCFYVQALKKQTGLDPEGCKQPYVTQRAMLPHNDLNPTEHGMRQTPRQCSRATAATTRQALQLALTCTLLPCRHACIVTSIH